MAFIKLPSPRSSNSPTSPEFPGSFVNSSSFYLLLKCLIVRALSWALCAFPHTLPGPPHPLPSLSPHSQTYAPHISVSCPNLFPCELSPTPKPAVHLLEVLTPSVTQTHFSISPQHGTSSESPSQEQPTTHQARALDPVLDNSPLPACPSSWPVHLGSCPGLVLSPPTWVPTPAASLGSQPPLSPPPTHPPYSSQEDLLKLDRSSLV